MPSQYEAHDASQVCTLFTATNIPRHSKQQLKPKKCMCQRSVLRVFVIVGECVSEQQIFS